MAVIPSSDSRLSVDEAIALLEIQLPPGTLNSVKRTVFRQSWQGQGYNQIADAEGYDADYLREAGASLWRSLSRLTGCKVTKRNFRTLLIQQLPLLVQAAESSGGLELGKMGVEASCEASSVLSNGEAQTLSTVVMPVEATRCDWDEAPDVSTFYGREQELAQLQAMLLGSRAQTSCRLVTLLGMGGMGKTSLAAKIAQLLKQEFDCVVWRSLRNAPPLAQLVEGIAAFVSQQEVAQGDQRQLLELLRQQRCLLILDNAETLLKGGASGHYRSGYENYGDFFRALGEVDHGSCLVVTSREKLPRVMIGEGGRSTVRSLAVGGAPAVTQGIVLELPLQGTKQERQALCEACGYSPLALKLMGTTIQELFGGSIASFLEEGVFAFDGVRRLLDEHIQRLTPLEYAILAWLAINREWTDLAMLQEDLVPAVPKFQLLNALAALRGRSLVEQREGCYSLQGTVMEYMTETIVSRVLRELSGGLIRWFKDHPCSNEAIGSALPLPKLKQIAPAAGRGSLGVFEGEMAGSTSGGIEGLPLLHSHALMKATAKEYIRETQVALVLKPIADYLLRWASSESLFRHEILALLKQLRRHPLGQKGYCVGNLLNLCCCAGLDLAGLDFSRLTLRQAYVPHVQLHGVDFQGAQFVQSTFAQVFGSILCLDFSPDGQYVALGDTLGKMQLWNLHTGQLQARYAAVGGRIHCLAFSPNGQYLASGSDQGHLDLWELSTGQRLARLQGHSRFIWSLAWGPSGRWLVTGGGDRDLRLWSVESILPPDRTGLDSLIHSADSDSSYPDPLVDPALVNEAAQAPSIHGQTDREGTVHHSLLRVIHIPSSWIHAVAVSPQGDLIVSASSDGALRLWDVSTGQYLGVMLGHDRWACAVTFSPDGQTIASASHDGTLRLWDSDSGELRRVLRGHDGPVSHLAFSPDGQWLASSSRDQNLRLWDVEWGTCCNTFTGHQGWIQAIAFSPDGLTLASGAHDQTLRLWCIRSGCCLSLLQGYMANVRCVDWHPQGDRLVSCAGARLWFWDVSSLAEHEEEADRPDWVELLYRFEQPGLWVARWSVDGDEVITASKDYQVRRYPMGKAPSDTAPLGKTLGGGAGRGDSLQNAHQGWVCTLRLSPDGEMIASGSADKNVHLWERRSGRLMHQLVGHSSRVCTVNFSADGEFIFSGGADHSIRQWTKTGDYVRPFNGHDDWVTVVGASPLGHWLASAGLDGHLKFWCLDSGLCRASLVFHDRPITDLAWSRDGQQLATCSLDHKIHLWDWNKLARALEQAGAAERLLTAAGLVDAEPTYVSLEGHQAAVWSVSFSPNGRYLASASEDGSCKIWQASTGACVRTLRVPGPYEGMKLNGVRGLTAAQLESLSQLGSVTN